MILRAHGCTGVEKYLSTTGRSQVFRRTFKNTGYVPDLVLVPGTSTSV